MRKLDPIINTVEEITLVSIDGNSRTILADGHGADHISDEASILRLFGDGVVNVADADRVLYVGSPATVSDVWNVPPETTWYKSALIVTVFSDEKGSETGRSEAVIIPPPSAGERHARRPH